MNPRKLNESPMFRLCKAWIDLSTLVGCQDHGCLFNKPVGVGTNSGCQCFYKQIHKPGLDRALGELYRSVEGFIEDVKEHGGEREKGLIDTIEQQRGEQVRFERLAEHYRDALDAAMRALVNIGEQAGLESSVRMRTFDQVRRFAVRRSVAAASALMILPE